MWDISVKYLIGRRDLGIAIFVVPGLFEFVITIKEAITVYRRINKIEDRLLFQFNGITSSML